MVTTWMERLLSACESFRPDMLVVFTLPVYVAPSVVEKYGSGLPVCWCHLMPFAPTAKHAPPVGFGDGHTYFEWSAKMKWRLAGSAGYDLMYKAAVDAKREDWGLEPSEASPYWGAAPPLTIMGYSRHLCPPPEDWDAERVHVVGSLVEGGRAPVASYQPPVELYSPLGLGRGAAGAQSRPLVFAFGSMLAVLKPDEQRRLLSACVRAACDLGVGGIVVTKVPPCTHPPVLRATRPFFLPP